MNHEAILRATHALKSPGAMIEAIPEPTLCIYSPTSALAPTPAQTPLSALRLRCSGYRAVELHSCQPSTLRTRKTVNSEEQLAMAAFVVVLALATIAVVVAVVGLTSFSVSGMADPEPLGRLHRDPARLWEQVQQSVLLYSDMSTLVSLYIYIYIYIDLPSHWLPDQKQARLTRLVICASRQWLPHGAMMTRSLS